MTKVPLQGPTEEHEKNLVFSIKLRYLLPSVVDIFGAGIKRTVVINKKRIQK